MNAEVVVRELESPALLADARLASTGRAMLRRLRRHEAMARALNAADLGMADELVDRACALRCDLADSQYTHPSDLTVCAYAVLLHDAFPATFGAVADRLLAPSRHFPWATALASALEPTPALSGLRAEAGTDQAVSLSGDASLRVALRFTPLSSGPGATVSVSDVGVLPPSLVANRGMSGRTAEFAHA